MSSSFLLPEFTEHFLCLLLWSLYEVNDWFPFSLVLFLGGFCLWITGKYSCFIFLSLCFCSYLLGILATYPVLETVSYVEGVSWGPKPGTPGAFHVWNPVVAELCLLWAHCWVGLVPGLSVYDPSCKRGCWCLGLAPGVTGHRPNHGLEGKVC